MFGEGIKEGLRLLARGDPEILSAIALSVKVSLIACLLASLLGIPLGALLAIKNFRGKKVILTLLNTLMAIPTVLVGLFVYSMLSRHGPAGILELLYTPYAIACADFILAFPMVTALSCAGISKSGVDALKAAETLGAGPVRSLLVALRESGYSVLCAVLAAFGRVVGEVGAALIVGGNIKGFTRTLTTAITLRTSQGDFGVAVALGLVLLAVALVVNALFLSLHWRLSQ